MSTEDRVVLVRLVLTLHPEKGWVTRQTNYLAKPSKKGYVLKSIIGDPDAIPNRPIDRSDIGKAEISELHPNTVSFKTWALEEDLEDAKASLEDSIRAKVQYMQFKLDLLLKHL